jgi:hypothetical protein
MSSILTNNPQWNDWFALPYLINPANDDKYRNYFSRQWQELLLISLHNFIAYRIDRLCKPPLVGWSTSTSAPESSGDIVSRLCDYFKSTAFSLLTAS